MAYRNKRIALDAHSLLMDCPGLSLKLIAARLEVDRHTLAKAIERHFERTFRRLQEESFVAKVFDCRAARRNESLLSITRQLGYSSARAADRRAKAVFGASLSTVLARLEDPEAKR